LQCDAPRVDLSDLLSQGYRALAQPETTNHVSILKNLDSIVDSIERFSIV
jgi:hypothetical protein